MRTVISIDLGATNLRVGLLTEDLKILQVYRERTTKNDVNSLYQQIKNLLIKVLDFSFSSVYERPRYIGVSACGFVSNNIILKLPNLNIERFDLSSMIKKDFKDLEIIIANDANAAAYTEAVYGAAKSVDSSFFITISSGLGGCLVHKKQLLDLPFEIGHMGINYRGKFDSIEPLLSGNGIVKLCRINGLSILSASEFFELVSKKDETALKIYDDWLMYLGSLIASLQLMFNVDIFVLSGGVMNSSAVFMNDLLQVSRSFIAPYPIKQIEFTSAEFDQDAGLIGGSGLALRKLEEKNS